MNKVLKNLAVNITPESEKAIWRRVGVIMEGSNGKQFILMDRTFNPAGVPNRGGNSGGSCLIGCFDPKENSSNESSPSSFDDMPF